MARHRKTDIIDDDEHSLAVHRWTQSAEPHNVALPSAQFVPSRFVSPVAPSQTVTPVEVALERCDAWVDEQDGDPPRAGNGYPESRRAPAAGHRRIEGHGRAEGHGRVRRNGAHRRRVPKPGGRAVAASVAVGAFLSAAASSQNASTEHVALSASSTDQPSAGLPQASAPVVEPAQILQVPDLDVGKLAQQLTEQLAEGRAREIERAARDAEARRPLTLVPVSGTLTSNYGARWGTTHYGLDIANTIGTPIVSVTDGEVIESGPAQGFGLWIRVRQDDGTIGVYGHINETLVTAGQRVKAGDLIATVGNRGQSTGPHLHYEVWQADGAKSDPKAWLSARGVDVT